MDNIVEYSSLYLDDVRDLLYELEEYLVDIDKDNLDKIDNDYWDKMALKDLDDVYKYNGKCYLYIEDSKVVGLIMGCIYPYSEYDYLDYKCPSRGEITELVVTNKVRGKGIGNMLMSKMEEYFKCCGCEYIIVNVFSYNDRGFNFYNKNGYHSRMNTMIKNIKNSKY